MIDNHSNIIQLATHSLKEARVMADELNQIRYQQIHSNQTK